MFARDSKLRIFILIAPVGFLSTAIVAFSLLNITLDVRGQGAQIAIASAVFCLIIARRRLSESSDEKISDALELLSIFSLLSLGASLSQYWVAAITTGYHDAPLAAIDAALGFDWKSLYYFSVEHPHFAAVERAAYMSIFLSPVMIIVTLGITGNSRHAERFIAAFAIALIATLAVFYIFPTQSALMYHIGHDRLYSPVTNLTYLSVFEALRASNYPVISLSALQGFVSFPSFHAVLAILLIWASWPVRWLRSIAIPVNIAMLIATPVEGSHYIIDVIAGIFVALGAIMLVRWLTAPTARGVLLPSRLPDRATEPGRQPAAEIGASLPAGEADLVAVAGLA